MDKQSSNGQNRSSKTRHHRTQAPAKRTEDSEVSDYVPSDDVSAEDNSGSADDSPGAFTEDDRQLQLRRRNRESPIKKAKIYQVDSKESKYSKKKDRLTQYRRTKGPPARSPFQDVLADCWGLFKATFGLSWLLYPIWKWLLLGYLGWLAASYLLVTLYTVAIESLSATLCPIPILGPRIPFCTMPNERSIDLSRMTSSQDELTLVMDNVGQNFGLAKDMVGHEFAVRDLRIRVGASDLARKDELTRELESLIRHTKQTAKGLSRFTAKVGKSIDTAKTFDEYAAKSLEAIAERQRMAPSLAGRIISAVSPFAAFELAKTSETEEQVKKVFISAATRISGKVKLLIDDSFDLTHNLDTIQETLDRINEIAIDELGDLPRMDVLKALWTRLARPEDHHRHESHETLLSDMTKFYEASSNVMRDTTAALNRIEAELGEFRDDFATPGLILEDYPLEVIISLLRLSAERLEAGKHKLERVEEGGHPQMEGTQSVVVKTVTATVG